MNDDALDSLIRQTHPKPGLPASFPREVWARIAVADQQSWTARWRQAAQDLFFWMARPVPAVAVVTITLLAGAGLGSLTAAGRRDAGQRTAYVTSINPLRAAQAALPE